MDQLRPAVLAGSLHIGPTGGVGLVIPPMPTWALTAVITGWIIGWLAIGAWKMATRDAKQRTATGRECCRSQTAWNRLLNRNPSQGRRPNDHALPAAMARHTGTLLYPISKAG
jgi:hypothetical protein